MKYKVFYDPNNNNEIKGYSEGDMSMNFPFIETESELYFMWNYKIENGKLKVIKESFIKKEWEKIIKKGKL